MVMKDSTRPGRPSNVLWVVLQYLVATASASAGEPDQAAPPVFSAASGLYREGLSLELVVASPRAAIHYTLDGSEPTSESTQYTVPITVEEATRVRARAFEKGLLPSPAVEHVYAVLDAGAVDFESGLPLVVVDTFGRGDQPAQLIPTFLAVCEVAPEGRATLDAASDFAGVGLLRRHGSSAIRQSKPSYWLRFADSELLPVGKPLLGLPSGSDWLFDGPYSDKTLMREVLAYRWSRGIGEYAPRTRFFELFMNGGGGKVGLGHYAGVYVVTETIQRAPARVDIAELRPEHDEEPEVSGGYILKIDRLGPGDTGLQTARGLLLAFVEPTELEATPEQKAYIRDYLDRLEEALFGHEFADPEEGYARYIDVDTFVDHFLLVEMLRNVDGYRLSTYLHKDRAGKLRMGPIWNYDVSLGNANYLEGWFAEGWHVELVGETAGAARWFRRLMDDPAFRQALARRWHALRRVTLATRDLVADVSDHAELLEIAQGRNFARHPILGRPVWPNWFVGHTYEEEMDFLMQWLTDRVGWIDTALALPEPPPGLQRQGDFDQDGLVTLTDAVGILLVLFAGRGPALPCEDAGIELGGNLTITDVNLDGAVNVSDPVHILSYLFLGTAPPVMGTGCVPVAGCPDACEGPGD